MFEHIEDKGPVFDKNADLAKFSKKLTDQDIDRKFRKSLSIGEVGVGKTQRESKLKSEPSDASLDQLQEKKLKEEYKT